GVADAERRVEVVLGDRVAAVGAAPALDAAQRQPGGAPVTAGELLVAGAVVAGGQALQQVAVDDGVPAVVARAAARPPLAGRAAGGRLAGRVGGLRHRRAALDGEEGHVAARGPGIAGGQHRLDVHARDRVVGVGLRLEVAVVVEAQVGRADARGLTVVEPGVLD